jgi:hypothetical protein
MKCPSCGYENREDARYCNLCQTSFVKDQRELPRQSPEPVTPLAPRREAVPGGETGYLNWFQRHLNWTWVLAQAASTLIGFIVVLFFVWSLYIDFPSEDSFYARFMVSLMVVGGFQSLASYGVGAWVLIRKNRSLWWLLIFFVPYCGWIIFLCLENQSRPVGLPTTPVSSVNRGLGYRGLKPQSENEKYWW